MASFFKSRRAIVALSVIVLVVVIAVFFTVYRPSDDFTATTKYGKLRGSLNNSVPGKNLKYYAFRGVPYAQPPVNELRFKGPKPPTKWAGVRDAVAEGNACAQAGTTGSEDCLYLNVYTPRLPTQKESPKLAVFVFIHGGAFQHGSSSMNEFGPDFILSHDVVVVTMNYRVGVMASLSLDTDDIPGNLGLKDQLQVLRWVNENIAAFGGDPSKVTLGGQSSGSVSASWLTLLPQTKSLIRSATLQSGTAMASWGLNTKNIEFANEIYMHLTGKSPASQSDMASVFMKAPYLDLYYAAENATIKLQTEKGLGTDISFFYLPNIEKRKQGKEELLILKDPESYLVSKEANDIPIIVGETKEEWTIFFSQLKMFDNEDLLEAAVKDLITYIPNTIVPGIETQRLLGIEQYVSQLNVTSFVDQIREEFFYNASIPADCNLNCKMTKFMHQVYIMADTSHYIRVRSKYLSSPTYAYIFNLESDYNVKTAQLPDYLKNDVIHGDDMKYIWWKTSLLQDFYGPSLASKALRRQVDLFTNFIKYGDPTPKPMPEDLINVRWLPVRQAGKPTYLEIGATLSQRDGTLADPHGEMWARIFQTWRNSTSP